MAQRKPQATQRRNGSFAWDVTPLVVLAGVGVALLQDPEKRRDHGQPRQTPLQPGGKRAERDAPREEAMEPGRGRQASSPSEIPKRGWKDILLRTKKEFSEDQVPLVAAGVTFYTLLALFPGLAAFVSLYGLFADPGEAHRHLQILSFILPPAALTFLDEQMIRLAAGNKGGQSLGFIIGLLASIWSANGAVKSLMTGLNIAYDEHERRGFVRKTLTSLGFTLGLIVFVITAIGLFAAGPAIEAFVGAQAAMIFKLISWPVVLAALMIGLALVYRYGPSRDPVQWKWISWGSAGVIVFWILASVAFSAYVGNFANYDKTYGSLGAVIGFMMWIYLSTVVVLAGAELNSEIEHQTALDTTAGPARPMGQRGAKMADTIGAKQGK